MYTVEELKSIKENFKLETLKWGKVSDKVPIYKAERIYRTVKEGNEIKKVATRNITLTFERDILPETIYLYGVAPTRVRLFMPRVRLCYNCFSFGYTSTMRKKEKNASIVEILSSHKTVKMNVGTLNMTCINCQGDHLPNSDKCHDVKINQEINRASSRDNIPPCEAKLEYKLFINYKSRCCRPLQ